MLVKKYGNRRLYDTEASRYITQEELAEKIRLGSDVTVVDAKTGQDLTQNTLTQLIIEGRGVGGFLPVGLLHQLIRLGDDALAEFFNRYVQLALEMYLQMKSGASSLGPFNPFAALNPFAGALMRQFQGGAAPAPTVPPPPAANADVEHLKRELEELKRSLRPRRRAR
jgi:polyhydroxyalkanoate synthesis repressor PhaR